MRNNSYPREDLPQNPFAVIDIGSTSVRMVIAQRTQEGKVQILESLHQAVSLGKDTFTIGRIEKESIEECVNAIKTFKTILDEYHIRNVQNVRTIATSAVREAVNRDAFLDRIFIATGFYVEMIDEADVNSFIYLSIQEHLLTRPALFRNNTFVMEVGGGSTQFLHLKKGFVAFANAFRFGSFRIHEMLEHSRAPDVHFRSIMENQIQNMLDQIFEKIIAEGPVTLIVLGGDARFAAQRARPDWDKTGITEISVAALENLSEEILSCSADDLVRKHQLTYPDAESLGPALLTYVKFARRIRIKKVLITSNTVREGVLREMCVRDIWTEKFRNQIIHTAFELGKKFRFDPLHAENAVAISTKIFMAMKTEHQLDSHYELVLTVAAILHEIGHFISNTSHHKHSLYLIQHSEIFGFNARDILITALVARYHRRAHPSMNHEEYNRLDHEDRIIVSKLAAILRVADALARKHGRILTGIDARIEEKALVLTAENLEDMTLEQVALQDKAMLFEQIYGIPVYLRRRNRIEV